MANSMKLIYPASSKIVPLFLQKDLKFLNKNVTNWRTSNKKQIVGHYKSVIGTNKTFITEKKFDSLGRKKVDIYRNGRKGNKVVIEIETSTIENSYNDALKLFSLLETKEIDYGVILFVQNNRGKNPKLTESQIESNWINSFKSILSIFKNKLFLYHIN